MKATADQTVQFMTACANFRDAMRRLAPTLPEREQAAAYRLAAVVTQQLKARPAVVSRARVVDAPCWSNR